MSKKKYFKKKKFEKICIPFRKKRFSIFSYLFFKVYLENLCLPRIYVRLNFFFHFWILHTKINNSSRTHFLFRPIFEFFFYLKIKFLKNAFGTATLKHYRTVNTHPKWTVNISFRRKQIAKLYSASYLIKNSQFLLI